MNRMMILKKKRKTTTAAATTITTTTITTKEDPLASTNRPRPRRRLPHKRVLWVFCILSCMAGVLTISVLVLRTSGDGDKDEDWDSTTFVSSFWGRHNNHNFNHNYYYDYWLGKSELGPVVVVVADSPKNNDTTSTNQNHRADRPPEQPQELSSSLSSQLLPQPSSSPPPSTWYANRTLTLVLNLRGELGNYLTVLAHALYLQRVLERSLPPGVSFQMLGHCVGSSYKWRHAIRDLQSCFWPLANVSLLHPPYYNNNQNLKKNPNHPMTVLHQAQIKWLSPENASLLHDVTTPHQIAYLKQILTQQYHEEQQQHLLLLQQANASHNRTTTTTTARTTTTTTTVLVPTGINTTMTITLPYLTVNFQLLKNVTHLFVHNAEFYHEVRQWFLSPWSSHIKNNNNNNKMNKNNNNNKEPYSDATACCRLRAEADETVFHFRNFVTELKQESIRQKHDLVELSPHDVAEHLFGHYHHHHHHHDDNNKNDFHHSDAATTNNTMHDTTSTTKNHSPWWMNHHSNHNHKNQSVSNNNNNNNNNKVVLISRFPQTATPYVQALQDRGWQVRLVQGQTGLQDFCLAMSTQSTLIGLQSSTYTVWASLLGQATTVRWYKVNPRRVMAGAAAVKHNLDHNQTTSGRSNHSSLLSSSLSSSSPPPELPSLLQRRTLLATVDPNSSTSRLQHDPAGGSGGPPTQHREFWEEVYARSEPMSTESLKQQAWHVKRQQHAAAAAAVARPRTVEPPPP